MGGERSCYDNWDAAKPPGQRSSLPAMPPAACHAQASLRPLSRRCWGQREWRVHSADLCPALKSSSHSRHPKVGGQSSPAPKAPGLQHTGGFQEAKMGRPLLLQFDSLSYTKKLQTCHVKCLPPQGKRHFPPEQNSSNLP